VTALFDLDPYPGAPRILFVGEIHSSHAQSWIGLLDGAGVNVRAFNLPYAPLRVDFDCRTYITHGLPEVLTNPLHRRETMWETRRRRWLGRLKHEEKIEWPGCLLAHVVKTWRPDIVHTFGLLPASIFFDKVRDEASLHSISKWVLQLRGGSDLAFNHRDPQLMPQLAAVLSKADAVVSDNEKNYEYMARMGVDPVRRARLGRVPGTGGIDVEALESRPQQPTAARRQILWPKAYESPWSKAMPVLEALKLAWPKIGPCPVLMLASDNEVRQWLPLFPADMRDHIVLQPRIARDEVFSHMLESRVMLAPSLVDGTPNAMWEAMAAGVLPIVSPLETITPLVRDGENVLFARNLYPEEIADVLVRAMTDDALATRMAATNREAVKILAGRTLIRPRVLQFYRDLIRVEA